MRYSFKNKIKIGNRVTGFLEPCYIVAEIGINHNGKLSLAKKFYC